MGEKVGQLGLSDKDLWKSELAWFSKSFSRLGTAWIDSQKHLIARIVLGSIFQKSVCNTLISDIMISLLS